MCAFLKILTLEERGDQGIESQEERQGKMLLHTEYSLLSLLHTQDGVVHHHGLFQVSGRGGCLSPLPPPPTPGWLLGPAPAGATSVHRAARPHDCLGPLHAGCARTCRGVGWRSGCGHTSCCSTPATRLAGLWQCPFLWRATFPRREEDMKSFKDAQALSCCVVSRIGPGQGGRRATRRDEPCGPPVDPTVGFGTDSPFACPGVPVS